MYIVCVPRLPDHSDLQVQVIPGWRLASAENRVADTLIGGKGGSMGNNQSNLRPVGPQIEQIAAEIGLSPGELNSLDWDIDFVDGPVVIFHGNSPVELLAKIRGLENYSVRIPAGLVVRRS